jgi:hypothetical protein
MRLRTLALALLAACALAVAACGGDEGDASTGDGGAARERTSDAEFKRAMEAYAECMREHGIDFPDPNSDDGPSLTRIDAPPEEMREAEEACAKHRDNIKPPELSDEQQQEFKEAALEHARCMREHGIDFPDPTFSEDGRAELRLERGSGIDPNDRDFKEAQEACSDKLGAIMEARP